MLSIKLGSGAFVLASALAISPLGLADDNHSNSSPYHQQQNIKQFETDAASFGMSLSQYKNSIDKFLLLYFKDIEPTIKEIYEHEQLRNPSNYSRQEVLSTLNQQHTDFANYLGITTEQLFPFLSVLSKRLDLPLLPSDSNKKMSHNDDLKIVTVDCKDTCANYNREQFAMFLGQALSKQNVPQYSEFVLHLLDDAGSTENKGVWRHSHYPGAWKVRD